MSKIIAKGSSILNGLRKLHLAFKEQLKITS